MPDIRRLTDSELPDYVELFRYAFRDFSGTPGDPELQASIPAEDVLAMWDGAQLVSAVVDFRFTQAVRGRVMAMGGIGGVATYPEHRGRGYVRTLMRTAFQQMRERGAHVSMLRPFKQSYYRKFGYETASTYIGWDMPSEAIAQWADPRFAGDFRYQRGLALELKPDLVAFWEEIQASVNGLALMPDVPDAYFRRRYRDFHVLLVHGPDGVQASALVLKRGAGSEARMAVRGFFWKTLAARDAVLHWLARHGDQVGSMTIAVPFGMPVFHLFGDTVKPVKQNVLLFPWMVRLVDAVAALTGTPGDMAGSLLLALEDRDCPWNHGTFRLSSSNGTLQLEPQADGGSAEVTLPVSVLSGLLYGVGDAEEVCRRSGVTPDPGALSLLRQAFPPLPFHNESDF